MAQLLKDSQVGAAIEDLIDKADDFLWLISPYIRLHDKIKDKLRTATRRAPDLRIIVVFGKNEDDVSKSINKDDLEFLKLLPHIHIGYEPRLHAKFFASEDFCIVTSMNLHQYSQNSNIEVGIKLAGKKWLLQIKGFNGLEAETFNHFQEVIENAQPVFTKEARGKSVMFGLQKDYTHSEVIIDNTEEFFKQKKGGSRQVYKRANTHEKPHDKPGYCIRTGRQIPFNPNMPLSDEAYSNWSMFGNPNYPERYCHFSGEPSNGETCVNHPILKKNWYKAKELLG
jgi:hypothetical protein